MFSPVDFAFGPRQQFSTGKYDWHRGIDIDGELNIDVIVAPLDGCFYDYRTTASGGNIVILEHHFADFLDGVIPSISPPARSETPSGAPNSSCPRLGGGPMRREAAACG